jgi:hypothetical protein
VSLPFRSTGYVPPARPMWGRPVSVPGRATASRRSGSSGGTAGQLVGIDPEIAASLVTCGCPCGGRRRQVSRPLRRGDCFAR